MRILLISSDVPVTSSIAGSPRAFCLFRDVARNHDVHLATFASSVERYEAFLASPEVSDVFQTIHSLPCPAIRSFWGSQWHRITQAPYFVTRYRSAEEYRAVRRLIWELIDEIKPDLLFADGLPAGQYIRDFHGLPRVMDAVDAISLNVRRGIAYTSSGMQKFLLWLESRSLRRFEVATARCVDAYIVCSPIDQKVLEGYHPGVKVVCVPNGVDTQYFSPGDEGSCERAMVFTGVMGYAPNTDAAHFLCGEILPRVRSVVPDIKVQLVGSDPPDDVRALAGNGVTVTGTVPDVRPFVRQAAVYVSPLRFGTGVKNKVLAALAMGKAVVASPESCAGLDVVPGVHLLVADGPAGFAAQVVRLLDNPEERHRLGAAGRALVLERYGWDRMADRLEEVLHAVIATPRLGRYSA